MTLFSPLEFKGHFTKFDEEWVASYGQYTIKTVFQPIWDKPLKRIYGYECLIRVSDAHGHTVSPLDFLGSFSDKTEAINVGVICAVLHIRNFAFSALAGKAFINIHPSMFTYVHSAPKAMGMIMNRIYSEGLTTSQVIWEITEFRERDTSNFATGVETFKQKGHLIAIDDYGQLDSNQSRVSLLKPDIVKIDRSLIREFCNKTNLEYLPNLIDQLNQKGICVVLEGVETKQEYDSIMHLPFTLVQGYYLGKPCSIKRPGMRTQLKEAALS